MAGICTNSIRKSHGTDDTRIVDVLEDGETITNEFDGAWMAALDWNAELPPELWRLTPKKLFALLGIKKKVLDGIAIENLTGRVVHGEEATNVKQYSLLSKDVTKTNIGTAYVNIPPGLNGERSLVEFTGCTEFRAILNMNAVGTGPWQVRIVRDGDNAILYESPNITGAGEKELDTDWQPLPAVASGLTLLRLQGKSAVGADDPIFRRCIMLVR